MKPRFAPLVALLFAAGSCATSAVNRGQGASPNETDAGTGPIFTPADPSYTVVTAQPEGAVYAHSATVLYRLTIGQGATAAMRIGKFTGVSDSVVDIALNSESKAYAATNDALYQLNTDTAACTKVASGSFPNSLSFVPVGTVDASAEALVGYLGSDYVRIALNGKVTVVRGNALGDGLESSGDMVSVASKSFLTVRATVNCNDAQCNQCKSQDCIVQVSPTTGALLKFRGGIARQNVYGLAFWAGTAYGFTATGGAFSLDLESTSPIPVSLPFQDGTETLSFYGAGSTTAAPASSVK